MNLFKKNNDEEFKSIRIKSLRESLTRLKQVGSSNVIRDRAIDALPPGKRISRTGKVYWETRANRSDKVGKKI